VQLTAGRHFTCALRKNGRVACWGGNGAGQLGVTDASDEPRPWPGEVPGLEGVTRVDAGGSFACALRREGTVHCWGRGEWGNIGNGAMEGRWPPTRVLSVSDAVSLAVGANHACARLARGAIACWGHNETGQLGDGSRDQKPRPVSAIGFP
jgi:alpha-tubulin suppressor-like RCC1 family protein